MVLCFEYHPRTPRTPRATSTTGSLARRCWPTTAAACWPQSEVCDAHSELVRAARELGQPIPGDCPICDKAKLVHVTYVFGPRLPKHGRCISLRGELARLAKRPGTHVAYVVEVCQSCSWNHLVRRSTLSDSSAYTSAAEPVEATSDGD